MSQIHVPVSAGELLDKISILEIKARRIGDPSKVENVQRELDALRAVWSEAKLDEEPEVERIRNGLREVNGELWDIEDRIREKEAAQAFDDEFIQLARKVYRTNDRRAALKRELNVLVGSELVEEKSYADYGSGAGEPDSD